MPKVFCIGFHKTGTSSLALALNILDYDVCRRLTMLQDQLPDTDLIEALKGKQYGEILTVVRKFDAFCDNPWPLLYKEIDKAFPGSKFILTIREESDWLQSVVHYFRNSSSKIRSIIYDGKDTPVGNEWFYLEKYKQHNEEVISYFKNRPNDLLVFDIQEKDKWKVLCQFLGKKVPKEDFPFENKTHAQKGTFSSDLRRKSVSLKRVYTFLKLPVSSQYLAAETIFFLTIARIMIVFFPFRWMPKLLGNLEIESAKSIPVSQQLTGQRIGKSIRKVSLYTPFRSLCLEQALCCKIMLNLRGISSTIYFGLAKEESDLKAHAWVRSGRNILTGNKGKEKFKVVSVFGSKGEV